MDYYQKKILVDLFESTNGLQPFTFYSRYKLTPEKMIEKIDFLLKKELVSIQENTLHITEKGRRIIVTKKIKKPSNAKYANIPLHFIDDKIELNSYYIPNISYISD